MYIVVKIHNNVMGRALECRDMDDAVESCRDWAEEQFQRPLTDEEEEDLENHGNVIDLSDADNHYTFQIGIVER
jgi:uncharacterized protein with von Willebrand factor type A (vWA) domain